MTRRTDSNVVLNRARHPVELILCGLALTAAMAAHASDADDRRILAALDTKYQKAVLENDADTMAEILADNFVLVEGDGKRSTKADLVNDAKSGKTHYEHQEDSERNDSSVRRYGGDHRETVGERGIEDGEKVDYKEWFSDIYVRTPKGWRYFFCSKFITTSGPRQALNEIAREAENPSG